MKLFEALAEAQGQNAIANRFYGVVVGIVTNNKDDAENLGRIKVRFPWLSDEDESHWARLAVPMAGNGRGIYFLPEVEDEVLVVFEHGDIRFPYVIGALWNGQDLPPTTNEDGKNNVRMIKSRSGHIIRLNDEEDNETIEIIDKSEENSLIFDTANKKISITAKETIEIQAGTDTGDITLSAPQGTIMLNAKTVEITSSADTNIEATKNMNLNGKTINLN